MIKPVIGIGSDIFNLPGKREQAFAYLTYVEALRRGGAIPMLLPPQPENAGELLDRLDGIVLAGGEDCDPSLYGEEPHSSVVPMDPRRQANELALAKLARERGVPTLGICLGLQMMNVAAGGSLMQDIATQHGTGIQHASLPEARVRHRVEITGGTRLAGILHMREVEVNSSHHQAIARVGEGLRVGANAPDGIVEGIEDPHHPFYIGVQWHPEDMGGEGAAASLFTAFIEAARRFATTKNQGMVLSPAVAGPAE